MRLKGFPVRESRNGPLGKAGEGQWGHICQHAGLPERRLSSLKDHIFCIGANHKTAPVGLREKLYLDEAHLAAAWPKTLSSFHFTERASFARLLKAIATKITGDARRQLKQPTEGIRQEQLSGALESLFPTPSAPKKD